MEGIVKKITKYSQIVNNKGLPLPFEQNLYKKLFPFYTWPKFKLQTFSGQ